MSNVHGLFSGNNKKDDDDEKDDSNNRYVGGIGARGGGSGLAVEPNNNDDDETAGDPRHPRDSVFSQAETVGAAGASGGSETEVRRTITMYRDGFLVDDGPYRRLDDPANAEFLRSLAHGMTPRELLSEGDVTVGLIDKRQEDYVETFRSFSGAGASLGGGGAAAADGEAASDALDVASLPPTPPPIDTNQTTTSIQVRLSNGQRKVVKVNLSDTVRDLVAHVRSALEGTTRVRLLAGFPPTAVTDFDQTVEAAGLKGASVSLQAA